MSPILSRPFGSNSFPTEAEYIVQALPPPPLEFKPKVKEKNKDAASDKGKAKAVAAVPTKQRQYAPLQICNLCFHDSSCPRHIQSMLSIAPFSWTTALREQEMSLSN